MKNHCRPEWVIVHFEPNNLSISIPKQVEYHKTSALSRYSHRLEQSHRTPLFSPPPASPPDYSTNHTKLVEQYHSQKYDCFWGQELSPFLQTTQNRSLFSHFSLPLSTNFPFWEEHIHEMNRPFFRKLLSMSLSLLYLGLLIALFQ